MKPSNLADFIRSDREPILREWEAFARTCMPASGSMDITALRDHAGEMLTVIAADLETSQTRVEQSAKSRGLAATNGRIGSPVEDSAAEEHGAGRAASGFTVEQMVAEFRALRASVIRLWSAARQGLDGDDLEDLIRFNEAIDQSLAESIARYNQNVEQSKEMFLAILGHDLRTPLGAIYTSARFMLEDGARPGDHLTLARRIAASAQRTTQMVGDLLDFTRSRLGGGIPVVRERMDMGRAVRTVVDEVTTAHPEAPVDVQQQGDVEGAWDQARISQALGNLILNAVQHGADGSRVGVEVRGDEGEVSVRVHNRGAAIPPEALDGIFNPMKERKEPRKSSARGPTGSLGLGLYIAERIVSAHGGHIDVESSPDEGTAFTVVLPRAASGRGAHSPLAAPPLH